MELKKFNKINNIISVVILLISAITYLLTIEPTVSFWDCGEFIASSYKLEVGHPPGNPVFQLIARFFTLFADKEHAAMMVNAMSALCSAFTIFFLYLTIVHLGRRIAEKTSEGLNFSNSIAVFGAGIVGALAYNFSDTFWFSAVEAEVYAMSSLFTAVVFWAMLKWEEVADSPFANRWIVLIAFLMGISIGVHLLNLLTIPALVFIYYYKKYEVTNKRTIIVLLTSVIILATILYGIIPFLPKFSAYIDLLFVNGLGLPMNIGATIFVLFLIVAGFWGIYVTYKKKKVLLNTIILCTTLIIIGYSTFAVVVIRSSANTPTNEYQPDNPFTLVRYLGREQYGSNPLIYGQTYASKLKDITYPNYYNVLDGKYVKLKSTPDPEYTSETKMLFPRMWSPNSNHIAFYKMYTNGEGKPNPGGEKLPTFGANLSYFLDYQIDFMYLRYFMWNFVGRQNDLHATIPGDKFKGNWESGIGFIDKARLGDQSVGPDYIVNSKAKNHYYFLPLILGLIGLFYQLKKDNRNWLVVGLLFILTGLAIVVYLNQPPLQPRERDYAYAGSFYAFTIWIGLAVMWLAELLKKFIGKPGVAGAIAGVVCLIVPLQMASENWDDHDRSGRYTVKEMAMNYLLGLDPNAILVTHGDNDTFPLWYIQEVEGVRTDVRIMNTSLMGMDWYIDQMQNKIYESEPIKFSIPRTQYFYGTNDQVYVYDRFQGNEIEGKQLIEIFKNPKIKLAADDGVKVDYIPARKYTIPVNKENVKKYSIVSEADMNKVLDTLVLTIPNEKKYLDKVELMILDYIANYQWDRPLYFLQQGGDINIGIKDYLQYDGYGYKFVPIKSATGRGNLEQVNGDKIYNDIMNVYKWDALKDTTINVDYQNLLTFNHVLPHRQFFVNTAKWLVSKGKQKQAVEILDKMQEVMPIKNFPINNSVISTSSELSILDAISIYLACKEEGKATKLTDEFVKETKLAIELFGSNYRGSVLSIEDLQRNLYYMLGLAEVYKNNGSPEKSVEYSKYVEEYVNSNKLLE